MVIIYEVSSRYIITEDEDPPHLTCPNKRFITKVMFLAAVARPQYDYDRQRGFDGKIGIFPLIKYREAKRTTKNQTKGEIFPEPLNVDKKVYYDTLVQQVLPAIKAAWPGTAISDWYLYLPLTCAYRSSRTPLQDDLCTAGQ
jgi:hypothetical protein